MHFISFSLDVLFIERNTMQAPSWRETFHVLSMQFPTMGTLLSKLQCEIQMFICTINSSHHSAAGRVICVIFMVIGLSLRKFDVHEKFTDSY